MVLGVSAHVDGSSTGSHVAYTLLKEWQLNGREVKLYIDEDNHKLFALIKELSNQLTSDPQPAYVVNLPKELSDRSVEEIKQHFEKTYIVAPECSDVQVIYIRQRGLGGGGQESNLIIEFVKNLKKEIKENKNLTDIIDDLPRWNRLCRLWESLIEQLNKLPPDQRQAKLTAISSSPPPDPTKKTFTNQYSQIGEELEQAEREISSIHGDIGVINLFSTKLISLDAKIKIMKSGMVNDISAKTDILHDFSTKLESKITSVGRMTREERYIKIAKHANEFIENAFQFMLFRNICQRRCSDMELLSQRVSVLRAQSETLLNQLYKMQEDEIDMELESQLEDGQKVYLQKKQYLENNMRQFFPPQASFNSEAAMLDQQLQYQLKQIQEQHDRQRVFFEQEAKKQHDEASRKADLELKKITDEMNALVNRNPNNNNNWS